MKRREFLKNAASTAGVSTLPNAVLTLPTSQGLMQENTHLDDTSAPAGLEGYVNDRLQDGYNRRLDGIFINLI